MMILNLVSFSKMNGAVLLLAFILMSCGGIQIDSTQTKGVDLKKYKTYAWGKPGDSDHDPNQEIRKDNKKPYAGLIKRLANEELLKKGFVLDTLQPDAIFVFNSRVEERLTSSQGNVNTGRGYDGYGYYGGGYYSPVGVGRSSQHTFEEGMLYVDMLDTKTRTPLWGGWAKKKLTAKSDVEADVRSAVEKIFNQLKVQHK
jgi:Domain of unknown function (DUF4136)